MGREILLLLGGNEGDPITTFKAAERALEAEIGPILARSRDHWTEPMGFEDARLFLNRALLIETSLPLEVVMAKCLQIETGLGRKRQESPHYGPRNIDIDMLLSGNELISVPGLQLPHPRMHERHFALSPAADIVPGWIHPVLERTILHLLNDLRAPKAEYPLIE